MKKTFRSRLLIDSNLQGALLCRVMLYWFLCVFVMLVLAGLQALWSSPGVSSALLLSRAMLAFGPALIASLVVLPVVLFDALRFSHRIAGPMHRLKSVSRQLADGERVSPVKFRDGDYWNDLAEQFNRIGDELGRLRDENGDAAPAAESAKASAV